MNKIFIYWWPGNNIGDDLLVANFIEKTNFGEYILLRNKYSSPRKYNFSYKNVISLTKNYSDKKISKTKLTIEKINYIENATSKNSLALIGGSIWNESTLKWKLKLLTEIKINVKHIFSIGNNISVYKNIESKNLIKNIFDLFDFYTVRDSYSSNLILSEKYYPDPIYSMKLIQEYRNNPKENIISVSFTKPDKSFNNDDFLLNIDNFIKKITQEILFILASERISKIYLISYAKGKDIKLLRKIRVILIKNGVPRNLIDLIVYKNNPIKIIEIISKTKYSIAGRFHSIVLSNILSENVYSISYDNKNENHLNDISKEQMVWYRNSNDEINKLLNNSNEQFANLNVFLKK